MGIPRLTGHLEPCLVNIRLGCSNDDCSANSHNPRSIIIDGPALAYHVYQRLLTHNRALNAIEAQPSYPELGQAVLLFLDGLEEHNVELKHIYFDGRLPEEKRPIRLERLEKCLRQLRKFRLAHANGLSSTRLPKENAVSRASVFSPGSESPNFGNLPASPFLVQSVAECLATSRYRNIVEIVPGEADAYCAAAAQRLGGLVLSKDSDLLVYDLGNEGLVAFFDHVEFNACGECGCRNLLARVFVQADAAALLGVSSIFRLAFEVKEDPTISLTEAVQRTRQPLAGGKSERMETFRQEYSTTSLQSTVGAPMTRTEPLLDNRISEFVLQCFEQQAQIYMYLPMLIEDPERASAWNVSVQLRCFAYSLLLSKQPHRTVLEFSRRGNSISPVEMETMDTETRAAFAVQLVRHLKAAKRKFGNLPEAQLWRVFGLIEVYKWYLAEGRTAPVEAAITSVINGTCSSGWMTWQEVHLAAQVQAMLYSLRIAAQVLSRVRSEGPGAEGVDIRSSLLNLSPLSELVPSRVQTLQVQSKVEPRLLMDLAITQFHAHQQEFSDNSEGLEDSPAAPRSAGNDVGQGEEWKAVSRKQRKKHMKSKKLLSKSPGKASRLSTTPSNNIYGILPKT